LIFVQLTTSLSYQMHIKILLSLTAALFWLKNPGHAQSIEKIIVNQKDSLTGYYLAIQPASHTISNVLVMLPGYAQTPESIFPETKLHNVAYVNNILVIAVAEGPKIYADSAVVPKLNQVFKDVISRYGVRPDQFVLGGFSAGGTIALRYAELCKESPSTYPINPKGVFTIDSPVDLINLWGYFEREIARNFAEAGVSEARFITKVMTQEYGTPKSNLSQYKQLTPFYKDLNEPGNERFLKNMGVRVYHDVDINWYLKERRRSIFDANYADSSELINRLLVLGNQRAEFVQSDRKGYRSNGMRHPHSWSIVNEVECIQWIKGLSSGAYVYSTPANWRTELTDFPLDFAPQLLYKGSADLRFAPGWGQVGSDEFWSYTSLWWLDGKPIINTATLQQDLEAYYTGLIKLNVANKSIDINRIPKPKVKISSEAPGPGNLAAFSGVISLYDPFMTNQVIELHFKASVNDCPSAAKTAIFFEFSPQAKTKAIWQTMDQIQHDFRCIDSL
jgi:pimeloyl-ACP methyl ester carboxylesterase